MSMKGEQTINYVFEAQKCLTFSQNELLKYWKAGFQYSYCVAFTH